MVLRYFQLHPRNPKRRKKFIFPEEWSSWQARSAEDLGFDSEKLTAAVEFAKQNENKQPRNLAAVIERSFSREPHFSLIGPTRPRGGASGMIIRHGYIAAEWGDTDRVDMTFSVTKSYLSTVAGLALDEGLIRDVHDPVQRYVRDGTFDSDHNSKITWHHLLNQTSDWSGELWGKPDWADRPVGDDPDKWQDRPLREPGTFMKYNDVRVNLLAYALTNVFRQPLPVILRQRIMDPIEASPTWRWHGYEKFLDQYRWSKSSMRQRRGALGWRHVHFDSRPRQVWFAVSAPGPVARPTIDIRKVDRNGATAD